ncbi:MAG: FIST signal transduction protein [Candidatus Nanopelagicales bacterium]
MQMRRCQLDGHGRWVAAPPTELDGPSTLVLAFGGRDERERIGELLARFPQSVHLGCSSAGEILGDGVFDHTVTAAVVRFDGTTLASVSAPLTEPSESLACGRALGAQFVQEGLRAVLVVAPGLQVNGSDLVRGLAAGLPPQVLVTGGLAGDGTDFEGTWVIAGGRAQEGVATAVGFYGDRIRIGHGSRGGWEGFGPERLITKSQGNVLLELDDRPALALYRQYLGDLAENLPASGLRFPLAVRESPDSPRALVRTLLGVDESSGAMIFAGDVPQGWLAQLMGAGSEQLVDGALDAAEQASPTTSGPPVLAVAISCVGRRMVLGESTEEELERTMQTLPPGSLQVGFYSYGELSPTVTGVCELHNQTMTLTTFHEV